MGRAAVYAAEDQIAQVLNRGGQVDFFGSLLDVPKQRQFADLSAVEDYLASVSSKVNSDPVNASDHVPLPQVTATRSIQRATWTEPGLIRLPTKTRWGMSELVVLHEYGHHLSFHTLGERGHGPAFRQTYVRLVSDNIAPEAGLLLTAALDKAGLATAPATQRDGPR